MKTFTTEQIELGVKEVIANSLALDAESIDSNASLIDELGADSLDLIEMFFSLEQKFGVPLKDGNLEKLTRGEFKKEALREGKFLSAEDVEKLAEWLPKLKREENKNQIIPAQIFSYVTVEALVQMIEKKLG